MSYLPFQGPLEFMSVRHLGFGAQGIILSYLIINHSKVLIGISDLAMLKISKKNSYVR